MSFLRAIYMILTLHCEQSERLISKSLDEKLSLAERLAVRGHYLSCKYCRRFRDHLKFLRRAARKSSDAAVELVPEPLPVEAKERIAESIRRETEN